MLPIGVNEECGPPKAKMPFQREGRTRIVQSPRAGEGSVYPGGTRTARAGDADFWSGSLLATYSSFCHSHGASRINLCGEAYQVALYLEDCAIRRPPGGDRIDDDIAARYERTSRMLLTSGNGFSLSAHLFHSLLYPTK